MSQSSTASSSTVRMPERGASAGIRDRADPRLVLADRVDQLYGQMWLGILGAFPIGAIATFEFWSDPLKDLVPFWWSLVLLVTLASPRPLYAYRHPQGRAPHAPHWPRPFGITA